MELGPEDVSLLERCPHFRGRYVQDSMELEPEDVSLLERCPHFRPEEGFLASASSSTHLSQFPIGSCELPQCQQREVGR